MMLSEGDVVSRGVAGALLLMSVASWVIILWKTWLLVRLGPSLPRSIAAFWQAPSLAQALQRVPALDPQAVLAPLLQAAQAPLAGTLFTSLARPSRTGCSTSSCVLPSRTTTIRFDGTTIT